MVAPLKDWLCSTVYGLFGKHYVPAEKVIPDHIVFALIVFLFCCIFFPLVRRSFSMERPGKIQQLLEVSVEFLNAQLEEIIGHGGKYLPMIGTIGTFILLMNLMGLIPGFMSPTSRINVTLGCALVVFLYYNYLGIRKQGLLKYVKHFMGPIWWLSPLMVPIEIISHLARPFSLTVRLFANIFGEDLIIAVFFILVPLILPLPIMALAIFTSFLQAFIFMVLTMVYIAGAVAEEH
ncbi:MAG: ATP synthase F0 subunit A [Acidobacteria bacterium]|nr:MAG: ATP synthase F0 subunit A [Acidobacteriota bacterium]